MRTKISVPVDVVWQFLTVTRETWWPEMRFEAVAGASLVETWTEEGHQASATGSVTRCEKPQLLGFCWIEPGWGHPLDVVIRLAAEGRSTSVTVTETGFSRAQTPPTLPTRHEEGWLHHLTRLKRASEGETTGVDAR